MAHFFDRHDICAAYNLYLQDHMGGKAGGFLWAAERHCKLRKSFKPSPSEEYVHGLSENALEIYAALCAQAGTLERPEHPVANHCYNHGHDRPETLFRMWAGACAPTHVYVWADSFEQAFEVLVEWLDENAPGCLVSHEEAKQAAQNWADEFYPGGSYLPTATIALRDPERYAWICEQTEQANDWTVIGHTSLKTGGHIRSYEWGGDEVETGSDEYNTVLLAGTEAAQEHFAAQDRAQAVRECVQVFRTYEHNSDSILGILRRNPEHGEQHSAVIEARRFNARMRHCALVQLLCKGVAS